MKRITLHWGWRIGIVYSAFALGTLSFVVFAMSQKIELVREDYYEESLKVDETMTAQANAKSIADSVSIIVDAQGSIVIHLPVAPNSPVSGTVQLYRPSSPDADKTLSLKVDENGMMLIPTSGMMKGLWKVILQWKMDNKQFETENSITL